MIAQFGEIHPLVLDEMGVKIPVVGFEVFLNAIPAPRKKGGTEKPFLHLNPLQRLSRDFAFVVDDAIVVVEAVMHHIEQGMDPKEATIKAMEEVSGPVIAIALVLSAVFIPVAFMGGITGAPSGQAVVSQVISGAP